MPTDPRKAINWLIFATLVLRLAWAASLEPSNDEAYHWLYAVHPALSYFDHPPMTAWVEHFGLTLAGGWVHPLSLRLGFVLLFAGSTWMLYRWTSHFYGDWAGVYAAVGLNLSAYYTAAGGAFALPDGPFLFFAILTYWQVSLILFPQAPASVESQTQLPFTAVQPGKGHTLRWLLVGLGFAGAMLSKYHAVFLPAGVVVFILITPATRHVLLSPGPYLAVAVGAIGFLPVVVWNANNEWASFKFQGGRAVGMKFRPEGIAAWLLGPVLYLLPGIWFALVREAVPRVARLGRVAGVERLLVCLSVVPLGFFLMVSCLRWVLLHWNLIGFVPLYVLAGKRWAEWTTQNPTRARFGLRFMTGSLGVLMALAWMHIHVGLYRMPGKDPTDDIAGWKAVASELESRGILNDSTKFLMTNRWYDSGQLAFAVRNRLPVLCYNSVDARGFSFWSKPSDWIGKSGYFVLVNNTDDERDSVDPSVSKESAEVLAEMKQFFQTVTPLPPFLMTRGGTPWREVRVFDCKTQTLPYPFDFTNRQVVPGQK